ncbi:MAG: hypothetical protein WCQ49_01435 [Candidatus Saccharibacteria bacterium]
MGFVVEPYSTFLCYEIADINQAKKLIPDNFKLIKTKIFSDDEPKYYCIFGCVRAHTSAFWGFRTEFYIIAEDKATNLLSWLIVDYDTNTISYDDKNGLSSPNSSQSIMTIDHRGDLYVDIKRNDKSNELIFNTNVETGKMKGLDQRLWLEGNLSIGYGRDLSAGDTNAGIFSLKFEPLEVEKALQIPVNNLKLDSNTWYPGLFKKEPSQVVCFPYAQHFISDSPGFSSNIKDEAELIDATNKLDFTNMKVFSTKSFKVMFIIGSILSSLVTLTFFILWHTK